jgi:hypothetical protein
VLGLVKNTANETDESAAIPRTAPAPQQVGRNGLSPDSETDLSNTGVRSRRFNSLCSSSPKLLTKADQNDGEEMLVLVFSGTAHTRSPPIYAPAS